MAPDARLANWKTDWSVQVDPRGDMRFTAELDPGVELLQVSGAELKGYQAVREGQATRVKIELSGNAGSPTSVHFEAHARIPLEGRWSVPAIRPLDAIWTGGTTTIVLDSLRVIQDCQERAGRRLPTRESPSNSATVLTFEASSPESVAELVFRHPHTDTACLVKGRLIVGRSAPELECQLSGLGLGDAATELEIDLPPTWIANRVQWSGRDDSLSWHSAIQADGSTRLSVLVSGSEGAAAGRPLIIGATSTAGGGRGPLFLPRVRPARMAVADETWEAMVDGSMKLTPIAARGLVWLNPDRLVEPGPLKLPPGDGFRTVLAWRWNTEDAEARVDREAIDQEPRVELRYHARVADDGEHLTIEGEILLDPGTRPLSALPIWIDESEADRSQWSFRNVAGAALAANPLDDSGPRGGLSPHPAWP